MEGLEEFEDDDDLYSGEPDMESLEEDGDDSLVDGLADDELGGEDDDVAEDELEAGEEGDETDDEEAGEPEDDYVVEEVVEYVEEVVVVEDDSEDEGETAESEEEPQEDVVVGDDAADEEVADENEEAEIEEGEATEEEAGDQIVVAGSRRGPIEEITSEEEEIEMDWYILKVQSNRENTICDALRRRVAVAGLDRYFGEIMVPTEDVAEFKNGKKKIVKRKLYPGYIVAQMAINDDTWFLVRETSGIGDFTGSQGKPSPMAKHEVDRIVKSADPDEDDADPVKTAIPFKMGDRVRVKEGTFENFEGDVEGIDEANGRVTVMINIFGRSTPFEAEHWQIESV